MSRNDSERRVEAVRAFNRFYTRKIGVLHRGFLGSPFSLAEVRVLYELAHRRAPTATDLCGDLGLDPGYLSRMLREFQGRGFVRKARSDADGRKSHLTLTKRGRAALAPLDARAREEVASLLAGRTAAEQDRLLEAMRSIEEVLGKGPAREGERPARGESFLLRTHRPGDMGWIVQRHGALYAREHGWNGEFEAMVAGIAAEFLREHDPARERCWIAERDGERVGSVLLVEKSKTVARLRLLLVEPSVRRRGLGTRLVEECLRFARRAGYRKVVLWTDDGLRVARHVYEKAGFRPGREEKHRGFGHDLVARTWERTLSSPAFARCERGPSGSFPGAGAGPASSPQGRESCASHRRHGPRSAARQGRGSCSSPRASQPPPAWAASTGSPTARDASP